MRNNMFHRGLLVLATVDRLDNLQTVEPILTGNKTYPSKGPFYPIGNQPEHLIDDPTMLDNSFRVVVLKNQQRYHDRLQFGTFLKEVSYFLE